MDLDATASSPTHTYARSTLATMSKQYCRSNWQLCCLLLRQCCRFGNDVEATFDFGERTKFQCKTRSTLLLFWQQSRTLLRHCCWCGPGFSFHRYGKLTCHMGSHSVTCHPAEVRIPTS